MAQTICVGCVLEGMFMDQTLYDPARSAGGECMPPISRGGSGLSDTRGSVRTGSWTSGKKIARRETGLSRLQGTSVRGSIDAGRSATRAVPAFKRPFDIVGAVVALLLLGPIFLVTAAAVKLTSPGPVLFRQTRLGRGGVPFQFLKFRSMYVDAEARKAELAAANERHGKCFKIRNDPRVTAVGRFIRRYSIDEFPQLLNVLRGDMSLVGPRPALPEEVAEFTDYEKGRMVALPGITGLWQVSGRAELSFAEMIELDLRYARECSLRLDIEILLRTVRAVMSGRGAY